MFKKKNIGLRNNLSIQNGSQNLTVKTEIFMELRVQKILNYDLNWKRIVMKDENVVKNFCSKFRMSLIIRNI